MQLAENTIVADRFQLNRLLGRGGMGSVWHATHLGLDVPCALKFIEGALANRAEAAVRFQREAKAAAQLRSPHVVQILDHGIFNGTPYIAMELLEGEDLGKRLDRVRRLSPNEVVAIVRDVARALGRAHACGIIHRDLKPDNIFLVHDDDREIAKVLDFGIAKMKTGELSTKTRTGELLGTPHYMSPEQAQGTREIDSRSDLWSLAVIVFECLTGTRPFDSGALGDLLVRIIAYPIPVPSEIADVPAGFDAWWSRAAARDPADRFQTAKALAESLAASLAMPSDGSRVSLVDVIREKSGRTSDTEIVPSSAAAPVPTLAESATPQRPLQQGTLVGIHPAPLGASANDAARLDAAAVDSDMVGHDTDRALAIPLIMKEDAPADSHPRPRPDDDVPVTSTPSSWTRQPNAAVQEPPDDVPDDPAPSSVTSHAPVAAVTNATEGTTGAAPDGIVEPRVEPTQDEASTGAARQRDTEPDDADDRAPHPWLPGRSTKPRWRRRTAIAVAAAVAVLRYVIRFVGITGGDVQPSDIPRDLGAPSSPLASNDKPPILGVDDRQPRLALNDQQPVRAGVIPLANPVQGPRSGQTHRTHDPRITPPPVPPAPVASSATPAISSVTSVAAIPTAPVSATPVPSSALPPPPPPPRDFSNARVDVGSVSVSTTANHNAIANLVAKANLTGCYQQGLSVTQQPAEWAGSLSLSIDADGRIQSAVLMCGPALPPSVAQCVQNAFTFKDLGAAAVGSQGATADIQLRFHLK